MGGEDENRNRLDSVERYDPRYNRWTHITNMPSGAKVSSSHLAIGHECDVAPHLFIDVLRPSVRSLGFIARHKNSVVVVSEQRLRYS